MSRLRRIESLDKCTLVKAKRELDNSALVKSEKEFQKYWSKRFKRPYGRNCGCGRGMGSGITRW